PFRVVPNVPERLEIARRVQADHPAGARRPRRGEPEVDLFLLRHDREDVGSAVGRPRPPGRGTLERFVEAATARAVQIHKDRPGVALPLGAGYVEIDEPGGVRELAVDAAED